VGHPLYEGKGDEFAVEILQTDTGIHHFHTFDLKSVAEIVLFCKNEFELKLAYFCVEAHNIHFCLQRIVKLGA
jgi:hypothetical protein